MLPSSTKYGWDPPLDDLLDVRVGLVHDPAHGLGHLALPRRERREVRVDGRVALGRGHLTMLAARPGLRELRRNGRAVR